MSLRSSLHRSILLARSIRPQPAQIRFQSTGPPVAPVEKKSSGPSGILIGGSAVALGMGMYFMMSGGKTQNQPAGQDHDSTLSQMHKNKGGRAAKDLSDQIRTTDTEANTKSIGQQKETTRRAQDTVQKGNL